MIIPTQAAAKEVGSATAFPSSPAAMSRPKRALDIAVAATGLVLSSPLWPVIALAIKLDDRGPVFYKQRRFGWGGQPFELLKFRTMHVDSDLEGIRQASSKDARITRAGRLLRAMGLDELPQLLSILKGHMSFVGPRALAIGESIRGSDGSPVVLEELPGFKERLAVRPGLTGVATIYLPKDADPLRKLESDLQYIRDYSFWLDVRLITLSLWISVRGRWETRDAKL